MSKIKRKRTLLYLILLFVGLVGVVWWNNFRISPEKALENFKLVAAEQPLFASPELNVEETEKSLNYLRKVQQELMDDYFLDEEITKTNFLKEVINVKKAADDFETSPSRETAQKLLAAYHEANTVYKSEVESLRDKIQEYFPASQKQPLVYLGSTSDNQIILDDLELMLENAVAQQKEIQKREKILDGKINYRTEKIETGLPLKRQEQMIDATVIHDTQVNLVFDEGIFFVETSCFQDTGSELPFVFSLEKNSDGLEAFTPKVASTNYYQKLNVGDSSESLFTGQGLEWHRIREGNSYRCNDLTYYADLLTLRNFIKKYKGNFIFDGGAPAGEEQKWEKGKELEQRLLAKDASQFYSIDLKELGDYYHHFWQKTHDKKISTSIEMNRRFLMIANKQDGIPTILNTDFSLNNLVQRFNLVDSNNAETAKRYFFLNRNNYSYVFLNFSESVWLLDKEPVYTSEMESNSSFANLETLQKKYSLEQIKAFDAINENIILAGY